jgi:hypothetical protein
MAYGTISSSLVEGHFSVLYHGLRWFLRNTLIYASCFCVIGIVEYCQIVALEIADLLAMVI